MSTILVVDDHAANRDLLVSLLGCTGHRVFEAANGLEALEATRAQRPQLVIADVLMPVMDGYEFVRRVRKEPDLAATPVIFYTANYLEREARLLARQCGVELILTKPAEPQTILDVVGRALNSAPAAVAASEDQFTRDHTRVLTDKLSEKVEALQAASERLTALVQLGQSLAAERDSQRVVEVFCRGARDIMGAACAVVGVLGDAGDALRQLAVSGQNGAEIDVTQPRDGVFDTMLKRPHPVRRTRLDAAERAVLPAAHQSGAFIGARIATASRTYGWMYFAGKLGRSAFTEDDERVVALMSAKVAIAYESARRLEQIEAHAARLEQRVAERTEALTRSNADLAQFAYVASHDLQEPLRMVASYTELLGKRYRGRLDAAADEFIDFAVDGARRMQALIRDLLAYSRIESTKAEPETVPLERLLEQAKANVSLAVEQSAARITHSPLPVVRVVPVQFVQVLQNLLSNALKFRSDQPVEISIDAHREGDEWIVAVRDNGIGIAPEFQERIFVIFQRLHSRSDYPGTGIGLAICKRVVERHGGRFWVRSAEGQGATFFFSIPRPGGGHDD